MIYCKTVRTREISREDVDNLEKWIELFFMDVRIRKWSFFIHSYGISPTVCYLGKTQIRNVIEFNNLTLSNLPQNYSHIEGLEIVEVNKENYLEIG